MSIRIPAPDVLTSEAIDKEVKDCSQLSASYIPACTGRFLSVILEELLDL